jgi:hypothetical protein
MAQSPAQVGLHNFRSRACLSVSTCCHAYHTRADTWKDCRGDSSELAGHLVPAVASVVFFTLDGISAFVVTGFTTQITKVLSPAWALGAPPCRALNFKHALTYLVWRCGGLMPVRPLLDSMTGKLPDSTCHSTVAQESSPRVEMTKGRGSPPPSLL